MQSESDDPIDHRTFRKCDQCGQPTLSQQPACVNCGAVSVQAMVAEQQAREERRFLRALFSRSTPVTYAVLAVNLAVYLTMAAVSGGDLMQALIYMNDSTVLIAFGAKTNDLLREGEWFRLVTPIFIHGGLIHLASNSYAIWNIGPLVEKLYGSSRYLLIYLLAGIGGVMGSYLGSLSKPGMTPSVGASGAIFGLFGLLFVFGYRYRNELPPNFRSQMGAGILPVIVINLFIGFTIPAIDNAAHIGGLVTGAVLTFIVPYLAPGRVRRTAFGLAILGACLIVIAASFVRAYQAGRQYLSGSFRGATNTSSVQNFLDRFNAGDEAIVDAYNSVSQGENTKPNPQLAARLATVAEELDRARAPDQSAERLRREMLDLIRRQQQALERSSPADRSREADQVAEGLLQLRRNFKEWAERNGGRYGFGLRRSSP